MTKKYSGGFKEYENKLKRVMSRMGIEKFNYDWSRTDCFIEFTYHNQFYRFEHSIEKAKAHNQKLQHVSDLFAQLVLSLEDICRMSERGIYDLSTWIEGMKALPPQKEIPQCFLILGFQDIPTPPELEQRYKQLVKIAHPDKGGDADMFKAYTQARDAALMFYNESEAITE